MKINFTLIILALFISSTSLSAKKIYNGYIITNNGEKKEGKVYLNSLTANELKVKFVHETNQKKTYKAKELQEYGFVMQKYNRATKRYEDVTITYVRKNVEDAPIRFGSKDILIQRKTNGTIKVYSQFVEKDEKIGGNLVQFFYVEKENGLTFSKVTKLNYKAVMKKAVADFPALAAKIGTRGFGYKHLTKIAKIYNGRSSENEHPLMSMQD